MSEPLPVVTGACQLVVHGTAPSSQNWENVYGLVFGDVELTQGITDAVSALVSDLYGVLDGWSDAYSADSITITDLRELDGPQFESTVDLPVAGRDSANPLPLQTAALISWGTSHRGRSFRGRTYIPGFTETFANGAHITGDAFDSLTDFGNMWLAAEAQLGIISRFSGVDPETGDPIPRDPGIISAVTSFVPHSLWKTQRRRAPRG